MVYFKKPIKLAGSEGKTRPKSSAPALRSSEVVDGKPSRQVIGAGSLKKNSRGCHVHQLITMVNLG